MEESNWINIIQRKNLYLLYFYHYYQSLLHYILLLEEASKSKLITALFVVQAVILIVLNAMVYLKGWSELESYFLMHIAACFHFFVSSLFILMVLYGSSEDDNQLAMMSILGGSVVKLLIGMAFMLLCLKAFDVQYKLLFIGTFFLAYFLHSINATYFLLRLTIKQENK